MSTDPDHAERRADANAIASPHHQVAAGGSPGATATPNVELLLIELRKSFALVFKAGIAIMLGVLLLVVASLIYMSAYHRVGVGVPNASPETTLFEKYATIRLMQVSFGMLIGFCCVFFGILLSWLGITAAYSLGGVGGAGGSKASLSLQSTSPGLALLVGGLILTGISLAKEIDFYIPGVGYSSQSSPRAGWRMAPSTSGPSTPAASPAPQPPADPGRDGVPRGASLSPRETDLPRIDPSPFDIDRRRDDLRAESVAGAIGQRLAMPFENGVPFWELLRYIQIGTSGDRLKEGLPIFIEASVLRDEGEIMRKPIRLKSSDDPLRKSLSSITRQLGADFVYEVDGGRILICRRHEQDG